MCRNVPLEKRARISGVMDMIVASIGIIVSSIDVDQLLQEYGEVDDKEAAERNRALIVLYITISVNIIKFIMGVILWNGAKSRNDKLCTQWLYVSVVLWIIQVVGFVFRLTTGTFVIFSTISTSLAILVRILVMFIVFRFVQEIRDGRLPVSINASS